MKIGAAVLLSALMLGLVACGGGGETATTASSTPATTTAAPPPADTSATETPAGAYPKEARDSFLNACTASADKEQCECALSYLEKNVPIDELVKAGLQSSDGGQMPKVLSDAVAACT
jgi:hypothetical protein